MLGREYLWNKKKKNTQKTKQKKTIYLHLGKLFLKKGISLVSVFCLPPTPSIHLSIIYSVCLPQKWPRHCENSYTIFLFIIRPKIIFHWNKWICLFLLNIVGSKDVNLIGLVDIAGGPPGTGLCVVRQTEAESASQDAN